MSIAAAVRTAAEAALRADAGVVAAFSPSNVRLYPLAAPTNPAFPYALFKVEIVGDDTECAEGAEATLTVDVFARESTYAKSVEKAEAITAACRKALTRELTLVGHKCDDWLFEFDRPLGDPDVLTEHRALAVTYLTSAAA